MSGAVQLYRLIQNSMLRPMGEWFHSTKQHIEPLSVQPQHRYTHLFKNFRERLHISSKKGRQPRDNVSR